MCVHGTGKQVQQAVSLVIRSHGGGEDDWQNNIDTPTKPSTKKHHELGWGFLSQELVFLPAGMYMYKRTSKG